MRIGESDLEAADFAGLPLNPVAKERLISIARSGHLHHVRGLTDFHSHPIDDRSLDEYASWGVERVVNMAGTPFHRALAKKRGPSFDLQTVSPVLDGPKRDNEIYRPQAILLRGRDAVAPVVRRLSAVGYTSLKAYSHLSHETYEEIARQASKHGLTVVGHLPKVISHDEAIAAGHVRFEHLAGVALELGQRPDRMVSKAPSFDPIRSLSLDDVTDRQLAEFAGRLSDHGAVICPTLVIHQAYSARPRRSTDALPAELIELWERLRGDEEWRPGLLRFYQRVVGALHSAGCKILVGTDAPDPFTYFGSSIFDEIDLLEESGLSQQQAWAAAGACWDSADEVPARSGALVDFSQGHMTSVERVLATVDGDGVLRAPGRVRVATSDMPLAASHIAEFERRAAWESGRAFVSVSSRRGSSRLTLRAGTTRAGGRALLEVRQEAAGSAEVAFIEYGSDGVRRFSSYTVFDGALWFANEYHQGQASTFMAWGSNLPRETVPILGPRPQNLAVAVAGQLSFVQALVAFRAGYIVPGVHPVLWGGYPDSEFAYTTPARFAGDTSSADITSRLDGGWRCRATFETGPLPVSITISTASRETDYWAIDRRFGVESYGDEF